MSGFWIFNRTNKIVFLEDLQYRVPPMKSINLLKATRASLQQIEKSAESGSLFKKKNFISIMKSPPQELQVYQIPVSTEPIIIPHTIGKEMSKENMYNEMELELLAQESDEEYFAKLMEEEELIWNPKEKKGK